MKTRADYLEIIFIFFLVFFQSGEYQAAKTKAPTHDSVVTTVPEIIIPPPIKYHFIHINKCTDSLFSRVLKNDSLGILLALNRVDSNYIHYQDSILVPDTFISDLNSYSPFPLNIIQLTSIHKLVYISYYDEAFAVYENGKLIRWGPVSLGKKSTPTALGLFHTNWKSERAISTFNEDWIMNWYFNLENFDGMSMHEYELPGYPASHACIRMLQKDAYWFYHWADQWMLEGESKIVIYGTPVIIYGAYPFGKSRPWLHLTKDRERYLITEEQILKETEPFLTRVLERQQNRDSLQLKVCQ
jgi:hypothetical protein